ncbi:MAG TPA: sigma-54 dependent transcriptional regulator [Vicinamibacterales bacterium]|nr:sigma-54 dependent transcriptional regulator [Vicinamibacterales bacterium]
MIDAQPTLLAIDDEPGMLALVERFARGLDFRVISHHGGRSALEHIPHVRPDVVLLDLQMPEIGGLDVLRSIREVDPECAVILMTAHASVESAIEAVKLGALDYLTKPLDLDRLRDLLTTVQKGIERRETLHQIDATVARQFEFQGMIGRSAAMQSLFDSIRRLAPHVRTVLISGETGTGKELVARAIHDWSAQREMPLVRVNCAALPETLIESELFGHVRGAFTGAVGNKKGRFALADGGTIFLDEIGNIAPPVQAKLLRVLQEREFEPLGSERTVRVDVRVIAATNRDLRKLVAEERFQQDLYYRLNVIPITMPALRERREDIPVLVEHFIQRHASRAGKRIDSVAPDAMAALAGSPWPGNVRELENTIERAVVLAAGPVIQASDVTLVSAASPAVPALPSLNLRQNMDWAERETIRHAMEHARGVKKDAAEAMGISQRAMSYYLAKYRLDGLSQD